jgi:hypothetical protein
MTDKTRSTRLTVICDCADKTLNNPWQHNATSENMLPRVIPYLIEIYLQRKGLDMSPSKLFVLLLISILLTACATPGPTRHVAAKTQRNTPSESNVGRALVGAFMPF